MKHVSYKNVGRQMSSFGWETEKSPSQLAKEILEKPIHDLPSLVLQSAVIDILGQLLNVATTLQYQMILINSQLEAINQRAESKPRHIAIADGMLCSLLGKWNEDIDFDAIPKDLMRRVIERTGCTTAIDLAAYGQERLLVVRECGPQTMKAINEWLMKTHGLELAK